MEHRPTHVPQFGGWKANDEMPFTLIFDNARAGRGDARNFNPNDPEDNPAAFGLKPNYGSGSEGLGNAQNTPSKLEPGMESDLVGQQRGDGHGNSKMSGADPSKKFATASGAKEIPSSGDGSWKGSSAVNTKENAGPEDSPNHQLYDGRLGNKPGSPYRNLSDGGNSYSSSTPGKSRLRGSSRADETPDRGAALPKFGAWDENDPSAGDGFTMIFNQHRNEKKQGGPNRVPTLQDQASKPTHGDGSSHGGQHGKSSWWSCCMGSSASE